MQRREPGRPDDPHGERHDGPEVHKLCRWGGSGGLPDGAVRNGTGDVTFTFASSYLDPYSVAGSFALAHPRASLVFGGGSAPCGYPHGDDVAGEGLHDRALSVCRREGHARRPLGKLMPFGAFAPMPLRFGGTPEEGWAASQHARMAADLVAIVRAAPLAVRTLTRSGSTYTVDAYHRQTALASLTPRP